MALDINDLLASIQGGLPRGPMAGPNVPTPLDIQTPYDGPDLGYAPVPEVRPTFTESAIPEAPTGFMAGLGQSFADNPVPWHPVRGSSGTNMALGFLLSRVANAMGGKARREEQNRNETINFVRGQNVMSDAERRAARTQEFAARLQARRDAEAEKRAEAARIAADARLEKIIAGQDRRQQVGIDAKDDPGDALQLTPAGMGLVSLTYAKGGGLPPLGRGVAGQKLMTNIINNAAGMDPNLDLATNAASLKANTASLQQAQKQLDAYKSYDRTVRANSVVLKNAMAKIRDTGSPLFNKPLRSIDATALGSEDMAAYNAALRTVVPEFARLLNNPNLTGQLTDTARKEIDEIVSGGYTLKQMEKAIATLETDATNRIQASQAQTDEIRGRIQQSPFSSSATDSVRMRAPNGQVSPVPRSRVEFYKSKGATVVP